MNHGRVAVLNAGSSSIKFAVHEAGADGALVFRGQVEKIGTVPRLLASDPEGGVLAEQSWPAGTLDHEGATREILDTAVKLNHGAPVAAVGHRIAHGGTRYAAPIRIDGEALDYLHSLEPLAPLHQPHNLKPIETIAAAAPGVAQVGCFDTAFHHGLPRMAQLVAIPRRFAEIRRYGFHGLSYEFIVSRLREIAPELLRGRTVIAHLGNGASLCALDHGRSIACTMGFTALDGLVMGTRCGAVDPGVLLHLMEAYGMDGPAIEDLLYRRSGLLGLSGISSDMRELRDSDDPAAIEAVSFFIYRVVREIGSAAAVLGGLDGLVFTGGIGENDVAARAEIAAGCHWLGLDLDPVRNARGDERISAEASRVSAFTVRTDEERMIARHTSAVLGLARPLEAMQA